VKSYGYTNIKIYNGGIKDWQKSGFTMDSIDPLPDYQCEFLDTKDVYTLMVEAEKNGCRSEHGGPAITLLDLRADLHNKKKSPFQIKTTCPTVISLLDDLSREDVRTKIPKDSPVITVTETGNRDSIAMRFLSKYGYTNIVGLQYGMRGWIKFDYPVE